MHGFQSGQWRTSAKVSHIRSAEIGTSVDPSIGSSGSVTGPVRRDAPGRDAGSTARGALLALFLGSVLDLVRLQTGLGVSGALLVGGPLGAVGLGEDLVDVQQTADGLAASAR